MRTLEYQSFCQSVSIIQCMRYTTSRSKASCSADWRCTPLVEPRWRSCRWCPGPDRRTTERTPVHTPGRTACSATACSWGCECTPLVEPRRRNYRKCPGPDRLAAAAPWRILCTRCRTSCSTPTCSRSSRHTPPERPTRRSSRMCQGPGTGRGQSCFETILYISSR